MKTHALKLAVCIAALLPAVAGAQDMTHYEYDAEGRLTRVVNPTGQATVQAYDKLGRIAKQILPQPAPIQPAPAISYAYDQQDQLIGVTDPRNLTTRYTVNGIGDRSLTASPDTGSTSYVVDATGNVVQMRDARGQVTNFSYDALHRLTRASYASGTPTTFEYDTGSPGAIGKVSRMTDESGQTRYRYDGKGRLLAKEQTTGAKTFIVSYEYGQSGSALGKVTSMRYPSGNRIQFAYSDAGRLQQMTLVTADALTIPLLQDIRHQPFGPVLSWTWGSPTLGAARNYIRQYDLDGRLVGYDLGAGVFRKLQYDAAGRIVRTQHSDRLQAKPPHTALDQSYAYDNLDRLTHFTGAGTSQGYRYDENGNRVTSTFGASTYVNTYDKFSNRLLATSGPPSARMLTYDAMGNLVSDGSTNYIYNARGRMQAALTGSGKVTYAYNGLGERVLKTGPESLIKGGRLHFVYDPMEPLILGEYDASGQTIQETVYLGNTPVAVVRPGANKSRPGIYYVYADHIDTPRVLIDSERNATIWRWDNSDPYALTAPTENPSGPEAFTYNLRFPGQYYDSETALHHNYHRDYEPLTGRYVQSDPIGLEGGINTYSYVHNNPLGRVDPLGLSDIVFNRATGTITITDRSGNPVGTYPAANNTTSTSNGPWPNGTYPYSHHRPHPESGITGRFGSNGNFVFSVPGRSGMGVHSGRGGPQSKTEGCIRTSDEATSFLRALHSTDPIQTITVQ
ncbi:RHS repeat-associated core domain-containing protein [Massilia endophytica]|uniref:RHS repeat-associated core domain-containing protein n=1 Tax=Massilia endophytica TaxID=2899220 RepID=UPI001E2C46AB|nr:RHS repeat-associated core domain-containing protein [Massilia endophytica]UGQ45401.1 type IV secretion protein Rhs [Massilia endophytica]